MSSIGSLGIGSISPGSVGTGSISPGSLSKGDDTRLIDNNDFSAATVCPNGIPTVMRNGSDGISIYANCEVV